MKSCRPGIFLDVALQLWPRRHHPTGREEWGLGAMEVDPRTQRSQGGIDLFLLFFVPPAGSRRHVVSFEAPGQGELPTCSLPSCFPCIPLGLLGLQTK